MAVLMSIAEAAAYITQRGYPVAARTMRDWRATWPDGERKGPTPLLISTRRLRYSRDDCDVFVEETLTAARNSALGEAG